MRILFLTRSFNSLAQRLFLELTASGHEVSIELDISDAVTIEAVHLWQPALVIAPFLKRAIPEAVWRERVCLVVHPGVVGDRGPSALDWAISNDEPSWGVTVLQAVAEMDAGPVWASETFTMRAGSKSSLYRREVTEGAVRAVLRAVAHFEVHGPVPPAAPEPDPRAGWRPLLKQAERAIDWARDSAATVQRKLDAADGTPGVLASLFGVPCHLFDGHVQPLRQRHAVGTVIARHEQALLVATHDAGIWIGHVRRADDAEAIKLPATLALADEAAALPHWPVPGEDGAPSSADIQLERRDGVVAIHFPFYNGAMSTRQAERLAAAIDTALQGPEQVLLLTGGPEFWCNGIHLGVIEAAASPADESWANINAIDDVGLRLIEARGHLVIAALQGNAGAGGVFLALAADEVWARSGIVLNPHYKNMGNLYGSEYWTYLLPRRLRGATADEVMGRRLPITPETARGWGLVDRVLPGHPPQFLDSTWQQALALANDPALPERLQAKAARRQADEATRPLAAYREQELARMRRNFYGFDPSYHVARSNFMRRVPHSWTPRHLAVHR